MEEEKKNRGKKKPKKIEPAEPGIDKNDSRIGIRAYARGRSYDPNRFGGVQPYRDPDELMRLRSEMQAAKNQKKGKKEETKSTSISQEQDQKETATAPLSQPELDAPETPAAAPLAPAAEAEPVPEEETSSPSTPEENPEGEEVEVEVDQVEEEIPEEGDDKKEGV